MVLWRMLGPSLETVAIAALSLKFSHDCDSVSDRHNLLRYQQLHGFID